MRIRTKRHELIITPGEPISCTDRANLQTRSTPLLFSKIPASDQPWNPTISDMKALLCRNRSEYGPQPLATTFPTEQVTGWSVAWLAYASRCTIILSQGTRLVDGHVAHENAQVESVTFTDRVLNAKGCFCNQQVQDWGYWAVKWNAPLDRASIPLMLAVHAGEPFDECFPRSDTSLSQLHH